MFSPHALKETENDNITQPEALRVLRGGRVEGRDLVNLSWRYRLNIARLFVVVAFDAETLTVVVTAWRKER
jgi:hypothetical protein